MRLNGNYCVKDESEEPHATSLEAIIMRAKFACHRPDESGLLQLICCMLHVILIKNAAVRWGSCVRRGKRWREQSCTISAQVASRYLLVTLHTAVCRDKSQGLRRSGRRKARGSPRRRSCCWWSRWGRGRRALRFPSRSNLAERNVMSPKEHLEKCPRSERNVQNTYHRLVATATTMMMAMMVMIMKRKVMSSRGRSCQLIKATTVMIAQIMIAATAIISLETITKWWQQECWAQRSEGRWCARE